MLLNTQMEEFVERLTSYESRNEASDALIKYLYSHNEYLSVNDDNYLSPFDFKIEEVDVEDV